MNQYVILFRGINVGGNNRLPMKELVKSLVDNGFCDVKAYIQSGNIVLKSQSDPAESIRSIVQKKFDFSPEVLALEESEFNSSLEDNPYGCAEGKLTHIYFCKGSPKIDRERLDRFKAESEEYFIEGRIFYLHAPNGIGRSKLVANIESCLGVSATGRNLNTVRKLREMLKNS